MGKVENLNSIYSNQKAFYGKAKIIENVKLQSYNTIVAEKNLVERTIKIYGYYSKTTAIHINEFLQQNGVGKLSKKEMEKNPILKF